MNEQRNDQQAAHGAPTLADLPVVQTAADAVRGGLTKPAETAPALRPPPPRLPPDPPKPTRA